MTYSELPSFFEAVRQAMIFNEAIFAAIYSLPGGLWLAWSVVLLAGLSEAVAQSIVLFINRVTPWRFWLALFVSAFSHVIGYLFWTATIWAIGRYVFERPQSIYAVAAFVGLAYAPRLFSFFTLTPFLGNMLSLLLSIWSLYVTIVAIGIGFELRLGQAVATSILGWLAIQVWYRSLGKPLQLVGQWLENRAAGVQLNLTLRDVSGLRRPVPMMWQGWKEQFERRVVLLPHVSHLNNALASNGLSNGLSNTSLSATSLPSANNGSGE